MRIVSKFHDFYDGVMKSSFDPETTYLRYTEEINVEKHEFTTAADLHYFHIEFSSVFFRSVLNSKNYVSGITQTLLCFCGQVYPIFHAQIERKSNIATAPLWICHSMSWSELKSQITAKTGEVPSESTYDLPRRAKEATRFMDKGYEDCEKIHIEFNCPVIAFEASSRNGIKIIKNPCLSDIGFNHLLDPYSTFQEIYMYLSGVLGNKGNPMVELSNVDRLQKAGFDKVISFRHRK